MIWYFTFGVAHPYADYIQPIVGNYEAARTKMFEIYGYKWAFQYHYGELDTINASRARLGLPQYKLLPEVKADIEQEENLK
jgi:hypothetical protein